MGFVYEKTDDGIVIVTMDMDGQSANTMNEAYDALMLSTVDRLESESGLTGVVFASAKKTFFAGGDLATLLNVKPDENYLQALERSKGCLRRLERLPVPVVAAINGAALGGGFEIALAANRRIIVSDQAAVVGLPEVTLALLPGAGGVVRLTALIGLEKALPLLLEGRQLRPDAALSLGLVDEIVAEKDALLPAALSWIRANPGTSVQPWDRKDFAYPGGNADALNVRMAATMAPTYLTVKTRGKSPAAERILDVAVNSMRMGFDSALRNESRQFCALLGTREARAAIRTFFFGANAIKTGKFRPAGEATEFARGAVIGAGQMGSGIAYVQARSGIETHLVDQSLEAAGKGKAYSEALVAKANAKGGDGSDGEQLLSRIHPRDSYDFSDLDIIVEAAFEDIAVKEKVIADTFSRLAPGGIFGTNTSTLPISVLAESCPEPDRFVGIHFFSPVERMDLVELIAGRQTSSDTLRKAYDYVRRLGKTPIVVNDSRGFFTSRVFSTFLNEGLELLRDGMDPMVIERAAWRAGMSVGPLQIHDEVTTSLNHAVYETHKALDERLGVTNGFPVENAALRDIAREMTELGRIGRRAGAGFYDYAADGTRTIWPGLSRFSLRDLGVSLKDAEDRILYIQAIESLRCLHEGVLRSEVEGNIGSIRGIGFPAYTGGALEFIRSDGVDTFRRRADELARTYGDRFAAGDDVYAALSEPGVLAA